MPLSKQRVPPSRPQNPLATGQGSEAQGDDGPVLGQLAVAVTVEVELQRCLHGLDLGRVHAVQLPHLRPAPYPGTLVGRGGRAQPRPPVEVLVGGHVAGVLLVLQLLLLLWWDRGNSGS